MQRSTRVGAGASLREVYWEAWNLAGTKSMKSTLFVRPNLTVFALGAIAMLVLQQMISDGKSSDQWLLKVSSANARELGDSEMRDLMRIAIENPSTENYLRLSRLCEQRGDFRRALLFLRESERHGDAADLE
jgi:hypothetical protein